MRFQRLMGMLALVMLSSSVVYMVRINADDPYWVTVS